MLKNRWKISVVVDNDSWILSCCSNLVADLSERGHEAILIRSHKDVPRGDICFYLGCIHLTPEDVLKRNDVNLVVHESDLPRGKGFAPVAWQILEKKNTIPVVLFEACTEVDAGEIYLKDEIVLKGHELMGEIRRLQGEKTMEMCMNFVEQYPCIKPTPQKGDTTYYPRRTPSDSRLNPDKSIREQFPLLRIVDNERHPAFFDMNGQRYIIKIEKAKAE